jgi:hypothetical protein
MAIRDRAPQDNTFLEELEFSDTEILYVMQRAVDIWNESLPPIRQSYTYTTFPFRYQWTEACVGELFRMAGAQLIRNDFKVNAGGIQLEDGNRAASYLQLGNSMVEAYKAWVLQKKYSLNMEAGFGRTANPDFDY